MKIFVTVLVVVAALVIAATVALAIYARLKTVDAARWHEDLTAPAFTPPGRNGAAFCAAPDARVSFGADDLARLDAIALAAPRTTRLAGSVADGRISWVTRSALMGYPDVTTAQIVGTGDAAYLCVVARQVIGQADMGVNGARLRGWLRELGGLNEAPDLVWQPPA